ncbi:unnamed protein product [Dicrocoelium dendriticum]|nr:unnamed protein product [Dicrocoelium dendriticum]
MSWWRTLLHRLPSRISHFIWNTMNQRKTRSLIVLRRLSHLRFSVAPSSLIVSVLAFGWPFGQHPDQAKLTDETTRQLFAEALRSLRAQDFPQADRLFHSVLQHLYTSHQSGIITESDYVEQRARVYSEMANVNLAMGRHAEAERLIKQTIQDVTARGIPLDSSMVVELSLKLAIIYQHLEMPKEASVGFNYCINTQEDKLRRPLDPRQKFEELALLGMSHNYFAKFLFHVGRSDVALRHAKRALEMAHQIYAPTHPNCLNLHCDIAVILLNLGRVDEARAYLTRAQELAEEQFAEQSIPNRDEIRTCLVHILLQRIDLEAMHDNSSSYAGNLIRRVEGMLQTFDVPLDLRDQYERLRVKVDVES